MAKERKKYLRLRRAIITFQKYTRAWKVITSIVLGILSLMNSIPFQARKILNKLKSQKEEAERRRKNILGAGESERSGGSLSSEIMSIQPHWNAGLSWNKRNWLDLPRKSRSGTWKNRHPCGGRTRPNLKRWKLEGRRRRECK